jgi:hypothetical protein
MRDDRFRCQAACVRAQNDDRMDGFVPTFMLNADDGALRDFGMRADRVFNLNRIGVLTAAVSQPIRKVHKLIRRRIVP